MKTLIIFLALSFPAIATAQQYQAEVRQEHWWWQLNGNEWEGELFADLYENGQLVEDNLSLSYRWFRKWPEEIEFQQFSTSYHILREGIVTGSYRDYYVEIYQNEVLLATSPQSLQQQVGNLSTNPTAPTSQRGLCFKMELNIQDMGIYFLRC